ncbi:MAG TPA: hypothetical protein PKV93_13465 [Fervidobacterium sp.]|nr:hypothetical protein [Fervidobacterium sp.]
MVNRALLTELRVLSKDVATFRVVRITAAIEGFIANLHDRIIFALELAFLIYLV